MKLWQKIVGILISISFLVGTALAVDKYYAHSSDLLAFKDVYQSDRLDDQADRLQERKWKLEDRIKDLKDENRSTKDVEDQLREVNVSIDKVKEKKKAVDQKEGK